MEYLKKFENHSAPQIEDVIESSYQKHRSEGVSDKGELFNLILADVEKEMSYGISLFVKTGMGQQIKNSIISKINTYLESK